MSFGGGGIGGIGTGAGLPGYGTGTGGGNFFGSDYSAPPSDVAPGGGTLPTGPTTSSILGSISKGLTSASKDASKGQTPIPQFQLPQGVVQGIPYQPYQPPPIQAAGGAGAQGAPGLDVMQLFQRLLG